MVPNRGLQARVCNVCSSCLSFDSLIPVVILLNVVQAIGNSSKCPVTQKRHFLWPVPNARDNGLLEALFSPHTGHGSNRNNPKSPQIQKLRDCCCINDQYFAVSRTRAADLSPLTANVTVASCRSTTQLTSVRIRMAQFTLDSFGALVFNSTLYL